MSKYKRMFMMSCLFLLCSCSILLANRHFFYSAQNVTDISGRAFANPLSSEIPYNKAYMVLWGLGDNILDQSIGWNVGDWTNFYPPSPVTQYQRGQAGYGHNAVQMQSTIAGAQLNSWAATGDPLSSDLRAGYYAVRFKTTDNIRPWGYGANSSFRLSAKSMVPTGGGEPSTCYYLQFGMFLIDVTTNKGLWVMVTAFDSRGAGAANENCHWDPGTNAANIGSYFGDNTYYVRRDNTSQSFQSNLWSSWKYFAFRAEAVHVQRWIDDVNIKFGANMSTNAADYRLGSILVGPELYTPNGYNGRVGYSVKGLYAFTDD